MEPSGTKNGAKTSETSLRGTGTLGLVGIVGAVALVLATLFTAWTPGNSPSENVFELAFTPGPTAGAPGTPMSFNRASQHVGI